MCWLHHFLTKLLNTHVQWNLDLRKILGATKRVEEKIEKNPKNCSKIDKNSFFSLFWKKIFLKLDIRPYKICLKSKNFW